MATDGPYRYRDHCRTDFRCAPHRRLIGEAVCFGLIFVPYNGNNNTRKFVTAILTVAAALIIVGDAFGIADPPNYFLYLLLFVGVIVGRMWGIQFNNIAGVEFSYDTQDTDSEDDNE